MLVRAYSRDVCSGATNSGRAGGTESADHESDQEDDDVAAEGLDQSAAGSQEVRRLGQERILAEAGTAEAPPGVDNRLGDPGQEEEDAEVTEPQRRQEKARLRQGPAKVLADVLRERVHARGAERALDERRREAEEDVAVLEDGDGLAQLVQPAVQRLPHRAAEGRLPSGRAVCFAAEGLGQEHHDEEDEGREDEDEPDRHPGPASSMPALRPILAGSCQLTAPGTVLWRNSPVGQDAVRERDNHVDDGPDERLPAAQPRKVRLHLVDLALHLGDLLGRAQAVVLMADAILDEPHERHHEQHGLARQGELQQREREDDGARRMGAERRQQRVEPREARTEAVAEDADRAAPSVGRGPAPFRRRRAGEGVEAGRRLRLVFRREDPFVVRIRAEEVVGLHLVRRAWHRVLSLASRAQCLIAEREMAMGNCHARTQERKGAMGGSKEEAVSLRRQGRVVRTDGDDEALGKRFQRQAGRFSWSRACWGSHSARSFGLAGLACG
ncbi:chromosome segregation protein SMC [Colletotrichum tofieldiae]|nr:chromosome segregation protein SMC [Colletotrichum tofieldiae]